MAFKSSTAILADIDNILPVDEGFIRKGDLSRILNDLVQSLHTQTDEQSASKLQAGLAELATDGEMQTGTDVIRTTTPANWQALEASVANVNTGTETKLRVTPDALAGSNLGTVTLELFVVAAADDTTTGDGKLYFHVPASLDGMNIVSVHALVAVAGTTGTTDIQIHNLTATQDVLSTGLTIDSTEEGSDTAAAAAVIDTAQDDLTTNDILRIDIDAVSTTKAKGLIITIECRLP